MEYTVNVDFYFDADNEFDAEMQFSEFVAAFPIQQDYAVMGIAPTVFQEEAVLVNE